MNVSMFEFLLGGCSSISLCPSEIELYEESLVRQESCVGANGQLCVATGEHTGRSADDKYIVLGDNLDTRVEFGAAGKEIEQQTFNQLVIRTQGYLQGRRVYVVDFTAGPIKGRLIAEMAWQALYAMKLLKVAETPHETVDLTIVAVPGSTSGGEICGFRSNVAVACDLAEGLAVICGTAYAGEIKKTVFTYASYALPRQNAMTMHASVTTDNTGNNSAVFFGLSGTGKTTLSSDPNRMLLGDDEHVWDDDGLFNIEAGCYAKTINLDPYKEPLIYAACTRFGTILENVALNQDRTPEFSSNLCTENTRAAYQLSCISNSHPVGTRVNHPKNIIMLTCDAYGVLPPVSQLTTESAIYHFLSGYTAKIAGTEKGIKEPKATFSRCFGAPFMPLAPNVYAETLLSKIKQHKPNVWLVNTGWIGGCYGVGSRIDLAVTREIINQILSGELAQMSSVWDDVLQLSIPIIETQNRWTNEDEYDAARKKLAALFQTNASLIMQGVASEIVNSGPLP
jgi:phosphoenolpyruvate carboxykinase (ATP)